MQVNPRSPGAPAAVSTDASAAAPASPGAGGKTGSAESAQSGAAGASGKREREEGGSSPAIENEDRIKRARSESQRHRVGLYAYIGDLGLQRQREAGDTHSLQPDRSDTMGGHSINEGETIFSFNALLIDGKETRPIGFDHHGHSIYPGKLTDQTAIFRDVENRPQAPGASGPQYVYKLEMPVSAEKYEEIVAAHEKALRGEELPNFSIVPSKGAENSISFPLLLGIPADDNGGSAQRVVEQIERGLPEIRMYAFGSNKGLKSGDVGEDGEPLLRKTGHVLISADEGETVLGYNPIFPDGVSESEGFERLKAGETFRGQLKDDKWVIEDVLKRPVVGSSGHEQVVFEKRIPMAPRDFTETARRTSELLQRPSPTELYGFPNPENPENVNNCATFPARLAPSLAVPTGQMRDLMPEFEREGDVWAPVESAARQAQAGREEKPEQEKEKNV
jgi:hypothetical protein